MWTLRLRSMASAALALLSGSVAAAQTPMVASTKDFVQAAAESDHFEIVEARTALAQSHDSHVRAFAEQMIPAHAETSRALQQAAVKAGLAPPSMGLGGDQQKLLSALQSQRGADFDRTYAKQQVLAHQAALVVEQAYAEHGDDTDVRQAARSAVPVIERHLKMAKQLRDRLGGV